MTEESDDLPDSTSTILSTVNDTVGDIVTGIPAPVRKNAWKAFGRLLTSAVEYPVALIETAVAERRAESKARVKLINVSAKQLAEQLRTDPEYARAAAAKFAQKIVRERVNLDAVSEIAAEELKRSPTDSKRPDGDTVSISDDWLNVFENEAAQMTSDRMRGIFGKILAGEISKPTSFSIKTLKLTAELDPSAASLFALLCSMTMSIRVPDTGQIVEARVASLGGHAARNSLRDYGLSFDALNVLEEHGLIISDYNSYSNYSIAIEHDGKVILPVTYQAHRWKFVPKTRPSQRPEEFFVHGVALTKAGRELLSVVETERREHYSAELIRFFETQSMQFVAADSVTEQVIFPAQ